MARFLFALCRTSEKHSTPTESNKIQIFPNGSEYFTRNASFLQKQTVLRGLTQVHPSCFRLGKVRTLVPSKSSLPQGSKLWKGKSIFQVETSKACMSLAFWNEGNLILIPFPRKALCVCVFVLNERSFKTFQNFFSFATIFASWF